MEIDDNIRPYFLTFLRHPCTCCPRPHIRYTLRSFHCKKNTARIQTVKLLTPQFSLFLSHVIFTKYVIQTSTLRHLLQFSPPLRFMTPHPNCLLLRTLHFNRKRNTQLLSTDNSGMEPSMLRGKNAYLLLYIRSSSERTTRKLNSNCSPSHSTPLYS